MKYLFKFNILILALLIISCDPNVKKEKGNAKEDMIESPESGQNVLDQKKELKDKIKMSNGLVINWYEHGKGEEINYGDVISLDYKVELENGEVVDGNHLLNLPSVPFMVGFSMQTEGWDLALENMKIGDHALIYLPGKLARGDKGIKGVIPDNAPNKIKIRILEKIKPTREIDGNKVWVFEENKNNKTRFNEGKEIEFHCWASSTSNPYYINSFSKNQPFKMKLEDYGMVPGLKKALINAKKSDRMFIFVPSSEAYNSNGYLDLVKPGDDLFYNVFVMDVR